jgi:hypothetical protein
MTMRYFLARNGAASPAIAFAQGSGSALTGKLFTTACRVSGYLYVFAIIIGVIYVLLAAFKYMSAGGDAGKVQEGHHALIWASVGIAVALVAGSAPNIIAGLLGGTAPPECP